MIGTIYLGKIWTAGGSIKAKGSIPWKYCNDGKNITLGAYGLIDMRMAARLQSACEEAEKHWSELEVLYRQETCPCDYCKYKELCQ